MAAFLDQLGALCLLAAMVVAVWAGPQLLRRRLRQAILPMVPRDRWSAADRADRAAIERAREEEGGGLISQAQRELDRLTANVLSIKQQIIACDRQIEQVQAQATASTEQMRHALAAGDTREARRLVADVEVLEDRAKGVDRDRAELRVLYETARHEMLGYEAQIEDGMRRAALAQARLDTAHNSIRARRLADGSFKETAIARIERAEREAELAEAAAEALTLGDPDPLSRDFARLREQVDLERAGRLLAAP